MLSHEEADSKQQPDCQSEAMRSHAEKGETNCLFFDSIERVATRADAHGKSSRNGCLRCTWYERQRQAQNRIFAAPANQRHQAGDTPPNETHSDPLRRDRIAVEVLRPAVRRSAHAAGGRPRETW